jgi:hypothetical protein
LERVGKTELGADAVAIGANVADDAEGAVFGNFFEDAVDYFRVALHRKD